MIQIGKGIVRIQRHAFLNAYKSEKEMFERCKDGKGLGHAFKTCLGLTAVYSIIEKEGKFAHHLSVKSARPNEKFLSSNAMLILGIVMSDTGIEFPPNSVSNSKSDLGTIQFEFSLNAKDHETMRSSAEKHWKDK